MRPTDEVDGGHDGRAADCAGPYPYAVVEVFTVIAALAEEAVGLAQAQSSSAWSTVALTEVRSALGAIRNAAHHGAKAARTAA